ncbi:MAG: CHAT domain-containing protein [Bryobacteraceae bacterium]
MRAKLAVLLVLASVGGLAVPVDRHVWLLCEQQRLEEAILEAKQVIREHPDSYRTYAHLALAYGESERREEGSRFFQALLENGGNRAAAQYGWALVLLDKKEAITHWKDCVREDPGAYPCYADLGGRGDRSPLAFARPEASLGKAEFLARDGKLRAAQEALIKALGTPDVEHNLDLKLEVLSSLANTYCFEGEPCDKAEQFIRAGLELSRRLGDWRKEIWFLGAESNRLERGGQHEEALQVRLEALSLCRERGLLRSEAETLGVLCNWYREHGNPQRALDSIRQERQIWLRFRNPALAVNALVRSASVQNILGDSAGAEATLEQGRLAAKEIRSLYLEGVCLRGLSLAASDRGEYFQALELGLESIRLFQAEGRDPQASAGLGNQGEFYKALGDWTRARAAYRESLRGAVRSHELGERAGLLANLGELSLRTGSPVQALAYLKQALALVPSLIDSGSLGASIRSGMAEAYLALGRVPQGIAEAEASVRIAYDLKNLLLQAQTRLTLGICQIRAGNLAGAEVNFKRGLDLAQSAGLVKVALDARHGLADVDFRRGLYHEAFDNYRRSIDALEALREKIPREEERTGFLRENWRPYESVVHVLSILHAKHPHEGFDSVALEYAERGRARAMLDVLERARNRRQSNGLVSHASPLDLRRIQSEVTPRTGSLIEYSVGAEQSVAWFITSHTLTMKVLPGRAAMERVVKDYRLKLTRPPQSGDFTPYEAGARRLYQMLLAPFASELATTKTLLVIPDGILHYVPFETLITDGRFLLETHAVTYAPSASALATLLAMPPGSPVPASQLLAYADPDFGTNAGAPTGSHTAELIRGVYGSAGLSFAPLPNTRKEVAQIGEFFKNGQSTLRYGKEATEASVKADVLTRYRRIHFATHAILDEREPARSGIVLSLTAPGKEDGILRSAEVMNLRMNADLVVLSACQTGLGRLVTGEGMLGLTRSFLSAGARRVVVSLWQASDVATPKLMTGLYGALASGDSASVALRQAKLEMIHSGVPGYRHPYYWAPFVLVGLQ